MPSAAYSLASDFVRLIPAARVTVVGNALAEGALPPVIVALTIAPPPRARMIGTTRRHARTAAMSLRSMSACHAASSTSSKPAAADLPALLTKISTPPKRSAAVSMSVSISAASETSAGTPRILAPVAPAISLATRCRWSARRAQITTVHPSPANRSAVARPSPSLPPVTIATFPPNPRSNMAPPWPSWQQLIIVCA